VVEQGELRPQAQQRHRLLPCQCCCCQVIMPVTICVVAHDIHQPLQHSICDCWPCLLLLLLLLLAVAASTRAIVALAVQHSCTVVVLLLQLLARVMVAIAAAAVAITRSQRWCRVTCTIAAWIMLLQQGVLQVQCSLR
jgi:hypothetical protein